MIYELITNRADVNMDDLTGTELEQAETELFKRAIAESLRVTMWIGDKEAGAGTEYATFNGFIKRIYELLVENKITAAKTYAAADLERGRSGRRYLRRRMDRSRRRADRPETRRTAGLLRHLGSLPPLREVSRLVRQHRGGLHRPDRRPAGISPTTAFRSSTSTCRPTCAIRPTPSRSAC